MPSDNMGKILTHQFEKDFNDKLDKRAEAERDRYMAAYQKKAAKNGHTKASLIRLEF
jgi:hypothetical protein